MTLSWSFSVGGMSDVQGWEMCGVSLGENIWGNVWRIFPEGYPGERYVECLGEFYLGDIWGYVWTAMQDSKSLCTTVQISATLVNTQSNRHTHSFWPVIQLAQPAELIT